jgi:hypothetical protein
MNEKEQMHQISQYVPAMKNKSFCGGPGGYSPRFYKKSPLANGLLEPAFILWVFQGQLLLIHYQRSLPGQEACGT